MKRSFRSAGIGVAMTLVLSMCTALSTGCGAVDADGFLALDTCDILNCDGLFFRNLDDDHDDMAGMDDMDGADDHDDDGNHMDDMDGADDHGDDGDDDHMDDMDGMDDHDDDGGDDQMDDMDEHDDGDDDEEEEELDLSRS